MKTLRDISTADLKDKKIILRVDFNVPISNGKIGEMYRIDAHKKMINYLVDYGASVLLITHHSDKAQSFKDIIDQISERIGKKINLIQKKDEFSGGLALLDNIRRFEGEEQNDEAFAQELARGFDFYINDAFAVCHRAHASVSAITKFIPSYVGFLIEKETEELSKAIKEPAQGKVLVLGGAKISTKLPVIRNFLDKADKILIGGAIANNFLKAKGVDIGNSVVDDNFLDVQDLLSNEKIILSEDYEKDGDKILDIGPKGREKFSEIISNSSMVIWNGPMGLFEDSRFKAGTDAVAQAVIKSKYSVIGGGDTIASVSPEDINKFTFVSTGGGAMLEFLAGEKLPGLEALGYYE